VALASLTFKEIKARPVICKLTRPAVARIGAMTHLPIILIDLFTEEGCRQELSQALRAESNEVPDPGAGDPML
jgi:hypothetical protein